MRYPPGHAVLVVNPNTSSAATARYVAAVERIVPPGTRVKGVTGAFGAGVVSTRAENVVAGHAALDLIAAHGPGHDAIILAISFDTALEAARELVDVPIVGVSGPALDEAVARGGRIGLVTFGAMSLPLYLDLVRHYDLGKLVAAIEVVEVANSADYLESAGRDMAVRDAALRLAAHDDVRAVVVCGAALAGVAERVQPGLPIKLLDALGPAVAAAMRAAASPRPSQPLRPLGSSTGLSPALAAAIAGPPPTARTP